MPATTLVIGFRSGRDQKQLAIVELPIHVEQQKLDFLGAGLTGIGHARILTKPLLALGCWFLFRFCREPRTKSQELLYVCLATHSMMAKITIGISAMAT